MVYEHSEATSAAGAWRCLLNPVQEVAGAHPGGCSEAARNPLGKSELDEGFVRLLSVTSGLYSRARGCRYLFTSIFDRSNLPDLEGFTRFEFPTVGGIYDANGQLLRRMPQNPARSRNMGKYHPLFRDAILAAEDKNFFSHSGVDYSGFARMLCKVKFGQLIGRLLKREVATRLTTRRVIPQGGSTITKQLVRGYFLKTMTSQENSDQLRHSQLLARMLSGVVGRAHGQHAGSER